MNDLLVPGIFIKTKGARDHVGLRRIVTVCGSSLMVDHYRWKNYHSKISGTIQRVFVAERVPFSSVVNINKVVKIYDLDSQNIYKGERKVILQ
jgi:hypothetical protein